MSYSNIFSLRRVLFLCVVLAALGAKLLAPPPEGAPRENTDATSLTTIIAERFPLLKESLALTSTFTPTSRPVAGRVVAGVQPSTEPCAPAGLQPAEQAAWLAMAKRQCASAELTMFFAQSFRDGCAVRAGALDVWSRPIGGSASTVEDDHGRLVYRNAYHHTDVIHTVAAGRSEEFMHLADAEAPTRFEYEMGNAAGDLHIVADHDGLLLSDTAGHQVRIESPWVVDATGRKSSAATRWELGADQGDGRQRLALHFDPTGLTYPVVIDPTWSTTGAMTRGRVDHTATLLWSGKVLVAGGTDNRTVAFASCELYDPNTDTWSATGSMASARRGHTATLMSSGKVLVTGGDNFLADLGVASCEIFDPATGSWSVASSMRSARKEHTATLLQSGKVLVTGGYYDRGIGYLDSCELYDPTLGNWSYTGHLLNKRYGHKAVLLNSGKVLVTRPVGGLGSPEIYSPLTGAWGIVATGDDGRPSDSATLLASGKVLSTVGTSCKIFDPNTNTWTNVSSMATARSSDSAILLPSGKVLVLGGRNSSFVPVSACELFDPVSLSWSTTSSLLTARSGPTSTLLPSGKVLVIGGEGQNSTSALATCELYESGFVNIAPVIEGGAATKALATLVNVVGSTALSAADADGDTLFWSIQSQGSVGTATITATGSPATLTYSPNYSASGVDSIRVAVSDGRGGTDTITIDVTINAAPVAIPQSVTTSHDTALAITLSGTDVESSSLTYVVRTLPAHGTLSGALSGQLPTAGALVTYTPTSAFVGTDTFTFRVNDGSQSSAPATVTISVTGLNAAPTSTAITDVAMSMNSSITRGFTIADNETAPALLVLSAVSSNTTLVPRENIVFAGTGSSRTVTITPVAEQWGISVITIGVSDGIHTSEQSFALSVFSPGSRWSGTGSMALARREHTATLLISGKVLVTGGYERTYTGSESASCELYDPTTGTWSATGSMLQKRVWHTATLLASGKVLVTGGSSDISPASSHAECELYDPDSGTWRPIRSMAIRRENHTATLLTSGKILVMGGFNNAANNGASNPVLASCELYDPDTDTWSATGALATERLAHMATRLSSGKVLVMGGHGRGTSLLASCELYDPSVGTWSATGSMTKIRVGDPTTLLPSGQVLVGGSDGSCELYNPTTGIWSVTGAMGTPHDSFTMALLPSGQVLATGGYANGVSELYNPVDGTWRTDTPVIKRGAHTATLLQTGKVLVTAGSTSYGTGSVNLRTCELYNANTSANAPVIESGTVLKTLSIVEDTVGSLSLSGIDADGDLLAWSIQHQGFKGSATVTPSGSSVTFSYTPNVNANGMDHVVVLVEDGHGGTDAIVVEVTIASVEDVPVAQSQAVNTAEDTAKSITLMGNDPEGSALIYTVLTQPTKGILSGTAPNLIYTPFANLSGTDNFTFLVNDGVQNSATASVAITVTPVNDPPTISAINDVSIAMSTATTSAFTIGDVETPAAALTLTKASSNGTLVPVGNIVLGGSGSSRTVTVTPATGQSGNATITIRVGDENGVTTSEVFVVTVIPGTAPWSITSAMNIARIFHTATRLASGKVLVTGGRSHGIDDHVAFITHASCELYDPATGSWTSTGSMLSPRYSHTATLLPTGRVLVTGGIYARVTGTVASMNFTYDELASCEIYDPNTGVWTSADSIFPPRYNSTATLMPSGDVLVAGGAHFFTSPAETSPSPFFDRWAAILRAPYSSYWFDVGFMKEDRSGHTATLLPSGKVLITGGTGGGYIPRIQTLCELFVPDAFSNEHWQTTGSMLHERLGHAATLLPSGKVLVTGGTYNSPLTTCELYDPSSGSWSATGAMAADTAYHTATVLLSGRVLVAGGAVGASQPLLSTESYNPTLGTWSNTGTLATRRSRHTATLLVSGKVLVTGGTSSNTSSLASCELYDPSVGAANSSPVIESGATSKALTTTEDTIGTVALSGADADADLLNWSIQSQGTKGTAAVTTTGNSVTVTYTPFSNANGVDSVVVLVLDGRGGTDSITVAVTIIAVNDAPVAMANWVETAEDTAKVITLSGTDVEGSALTYTITTAPLHGTLSGSAPNLNYIPAANYGGADQFAFRVTDGSSTSLPATVSILVWAVNDPPVAISQTVTTTEDTPKVITIAGTDVEGSPLYIMLLTSPAHGWLSGTVPNLTYTPSAHFTGTDSFTFRVVDDGQLNSATATVSITVTASTQTTVTTTLQNGLNGYIGTTDAYLSRSSPTNTQGGTGMLLTSTQDQIGNDTRTIVIRFPIFVSEGGPVPDGSTINSATLSLYQSTAVAHNFGAYRLLKSWSEATSSWNSASSSLLWTTPGANGLGTDIIAAADGTGATTAAMGWLHINVTQGVQAFATGANNFGWRIKGIGGSSSNESFRSRENAPDTTQRPKLIITYTTLASGNG